MNSFSIKNNKAVLKFNKKFYSFKDIMPAATKFYDIFSSSMNIPFSHIITEVDDSYLTVVLSPRKGQIKESLVHDYCNFVLKKSIERKNEDNLPYKQPEGDSCTC